MAPAVAALMLVLSACAASSRQALPSPSPASAPPGQDAQRGSLDDPTAPVAPQLRAGSEAGGQKTATARATPLPPLFFEYVAQPGDTVGEIADRFGVSASTVHWNNERYTKLEPSTPVPPNVTLRIPAADGILHLFVQGRYPDLNALAARYGADPADILGYPANGLDGDATRLQDGAIILVPGGTRLTGEPAPERWTPPVAAPVRTNNAHARGVTFATELGDPVRAAADGRVIYVGSGELSPIVPRNAHGLQVVIEHGGRFMTFYANLADPRVAVGDRVAAGELIAEVGPGGPSAGQPVTGAPMHFEILVDYRPVDPAAYLPQAHSARGSHIVRVTQRSLAKSR